MASKKHADVIRAWLDGAIIQWFDKVMSKWKDCDEKDGPMFVETVEYRVKPAGLPKAYPISKLTNEQLRKYAEKYEARWQFEAIANLALRHAIDAGQVVSRDEFDQMTNIALGI